MLKTLKPIAVAFFLATLATTVNAGPIETGTPKSGRIVASKPAKPQMQTPCFWLVLGIGF
jgi:hypothetical protein